MGDRDLMKAAKSGNKEAFLKLMEPLENKLYQTGLGIVGSVPDAEDVWQNTILKSWQHIRSMKSEFFSTWITRILLNEAKAVLRNRAMTPVPQDEIREMATADYDVTKRIVVHSCLAKLNIDQRQAILLRFWLDLPLEDIANITRVPLSTAKTRLYQGLETLKKNLCKEEIW